MTLMAPFIRLLYPAVQVLAGVKWWNEKCVLMPSGWRTVYWCAHVAVLIAVVWGWSNNSVFMLLADANLLSWLFIYAAPASIVAWRSLVALLFLLAFRTWMKMLSRTAFWKFLFGFHRRLLFRRCLQNGFRRMLGFPLLHFHVHVRRLSLLWRSCR